MRRHITSTLSVQNIHYAENRPEQKRGRNVRLLTFLDSGNGRLANLRLPPHLPPFLRDSQRGNPITLRDGQWRNAVPFRNWPSSAHVNSWDFFFLHGCLMCRNPIPAHLIVILLRKHVKKKRSPVSSFPLFVGCILPYNFHAVQCVCTYILHILIRSFHRVMLAFFCLSHLFFFLDPHSCLGFFCLIAHAGHCLPAVLDYGYSVF